MCFRKSFNNVFLKWLWFVVLYTVLCKTSGEADSSDVINKESTVVIAILVRNKAHTLPYFLTLLERLDYPKDRISLW